MVHLILSKSSDPIYDKKWLRAINNLKLPYEGKFRKGYCIPFVEEIKFYQARLKKETVDGFLDRVRPFNLMDEKDVQGFLGVMNGHEGSYEERAGAEWTNRTKTSKLRIKMVGFFYRRIVRLLNKLGIKKVEYSAKSEYQKLTDGHSMTFLLGEIKDPVDKTFGEQL